MVNYKITLTPLEKFFFGGENVLGAEGGQDERRRTYMANSNLLPQQTTLLGLIREQLLAQNDCLINSNSTDATLANAQMLVGETGFSPKNNGSGYGIIKSVSPIQIQCEQSILWQPTGFDDCKMAKNKYTQPDWLALKIDKDSGKPFLENFSPKEKMPLLFSNGSESKPLDKFFGEYSQVGIKITNRRKYKSLSEKDQEEGFFRQTFRSNYGSAFAGTGGYASFVFYVQFDDTINQFKFAGNIVKMGGECSAFRMQVESMNVADTFDVYLLPVGYQNAVQMEGNAKRIVLLSDAYADWKAVQLDANKKPRVLFAITQTRPFRYFTTKLAKDTQYFDFKNSEATRTQSGLFQLLSRGSVIYTNTEDEAKDIGAYLEQQLAFRNIGYNYYKII